MQWCFWLAWLPATSGNSRCLVIGAIFSTIFVCHDPLAWGWVDMIGSSLALLSGEVFCGPLSLPHPALEPCSTCVPLLLSFFNGVDLFSLVLFLALVFLEGWFANTTPWSVLIFLGFRALVVLENVVTSLPHGAFPSSSASLQVGVAFCRFGYLKLWLFWCLKCTRGLQARNL